MKHQGPIAGIASHGDYVATAGYDNQLILWDRLTRKALARGLHDHLINACSFSHSGEFIVTASSDYSARIWSVPDLRLTSCLFGHEDDVDMAAFSPDDSLIATCALDRKVRIFDVKGNCLGVFEGHEGNIISLDWASDGTTVMSSSVDGTVRVWDVATGLERRRYDLQGVRTDTIAVTQAGDIIAGDDNGQIVILRDDGANAIMAHAAGVKKIVWHEPSRRLLSLGYDGALAVWSLSSSAALTLVDRAPLPPMVWARAACMLSTHELGVGVFGSTYASYDLLNQTWNLEGVEPDRSLNAVCVAADQVYAIGDAGVLLENGRAICDMRSLCNFLQTAAERLFSGGHLGQLYDARSGEVLYQHDSPLNCACAFERHGRPHLAVGAYTGEVLVFDVGDGQCRLVAAQRVFENAVKGLAASEREIFSLCANRKATIIDILTLRPSRSLDHTHDKIANACCYIKGQGFASVGRDRTLRLWFAEETSVYDTPHNRSVKTLCASLDGRLIASGAYSGTVAIFDLQQRAFTAFYRPSASGISSLSWDGVAQGFLAASYDGSIYPIPVRTAPEAALTQCKDAA
ncbi:MAG: WD40 repeat domain-containing protein [Asticcacaulis sp.]|uniref:WD40 repeat domain-containing protein n=1 Tax=Asticcacaulis sp. TaxID=1872648 RepID=UPI003F7C3A9B